MFLRHTFKAIFIMPLMAVSIPSSAEIVEVDPTLTSRQWEIVRTAISVEGYVSKDLHWEFWSLMPEFVKADSKAPQLIEQMFLDVRKERIDFQRETWQSVRESIKAGKVVWTPGFLKSKESVVAASDNPYFQSKAQESLKSAERLIAAAASGAPIEVRGRLTYITLDLADRVLSGIDASDFRLRKLLSPIWDETRIEFKYPSAHVSVLSVTPFSIEKQKISTPEIRDVEVINISQRLDHNTYVAVAFTATSGQYVDPVKSLTSNATAAVEGAGARGGRPIFTSWNGLNSALASGRADTSEGELFISVRIVEVPQIPGIIQFTAVSGKSAADVMNQRSILENSSKILP